MVVDPSAIQAGDAVYAHHTPRGHAPDAGQFVGTVVDVHHYHDVHYVHVRGGLEHANELYLPLGAVSLVLAKQVHLNLSLEQLAGAAWHLPPGAPPA